MPGGKIIFMSKIRQPTVHYSQPWLTRWLFYGGLTAAYTRALLSLQYFTCNLITLWNASEYFKQQLT